jgi:hypothetical protein
MAPSTSYSTSPIDEHSYDSITPPYDPRRRRDVSAHRLSELPVHGSPSPSSARPLQGFEHPCRRSSDPIVDGQSHSYHTDDGHSPVTDFVFDHTLHAYHLESYPLKLVTSYRHYFLFWLPKLIRQRCDSPNTPSTCKEALATSLLLIIPARTTSRNVAWIPALRYLIIPPRNTLKALRAGTKLITTLRVTANSYIPKSPSLSVIANIRRQTASTKPTGTPRIMQ